MNVLAILLLVYKVMLLDILTIYLFAAVVYKKAETESKSKKAKNNCDTEKMDMSWFTLSILKHIIYSITCKLVAKWQSTVCIYFDDQVKVALPTSTVLDQSVRKYNLFIRMYIVCEQILN